MLFVCDIAVPPGRGEFILVVALELVFAHGVTVDEVELGVVFRLAGGGVNMEAAKSLAPFVQLPFGGLIDKVLVAEDDDTALGNVQGELADMSRGL